MGCNCGKARRVQTSSATGKPRTSTTPAAPVVTNPNGTNTTASHNQRVTQSFELRRRDGSTQTFGSHLEAEAERVRSGGGYVTPR